MQARAGDRIVVRGRTLGRPDREGTVTDVRGADPGVMYQVAWDDGEESMFMPSGGVAVIVGEREKTTTADHVRLECRVELALTERDGSCHATASLQTRRGTFRGEGDANKHPDDPDVPMIGEELAIARALSALAEVLQAEAADAIADHENRPIHLVSP